MNQLDNPDMTLALQQAGQVRASRTWAANLLSASSSRAQLEWDDLTALPAWVYLPVADRDAEVLNAGAWAHLDQLRRCIDGKLLMQLATLVGQDAVDALLWAKPLAHGDGEPMASLQFELSNRQPDDLRAHLWHIGQWVLLLGISRHRLRRCLAEVLWPDDAHLQGDINPPGMTPLLASAIGRVMRATHQLEVS